MRRLYAGILFIVWCVVAFSARPLLLKNTVNLTPIKKLHRYVIVIDPGHGGKDTGAIGADGVKEKDVALAVAEDLAKQINAQPHMRAILTRDRDHFVSLRTRLALARRGRVDLFVAIHADSDLNNMARGASVYALSQRGASREAAHWLAKRENYTSLDEVAFNNLRDQSPVVRSVLIDMAQSATITESLQLGQHVLSALNKVTALHYRRVEQAPFMVLKSPDIPSVLVELGYVSNPREERHLADANYQHQLAKALLTGVKRYLAVDGIPLQ